MPICRLSGEERPPIKATEYIGLASKVTQHQLRNDSTPGSFFFVVWSIVGHKLSQEDEDVLVSAHC